jgi:hypothetical protein
VLVQQVKLGLEFEGPVALWPYSDEIAELRPIEDVAIDILEAIEAGLGDAGRTDSILPRGESAGSRSRSLPFRLGAFGAAVIGAG